MYHADTHCVFFVSRAVRVLGSYRHDKAWHNKPKNNSIPHSTTRKLTNYKMEMVYNMVRRYFPLLVSCGYVAKDTVLPHCRSNDPFASQLSCSPVTDVHPLCSQLLHQSHQYLVSAGFLVASLSSSAIVIPLLGFHVPRAYGAYLILLYITYLIVSIVVEVKNIWFGFGGERSWGRVWRVSCHISYWFCSELVYLPVQRGHTRSFIHS